MAMRALIGIALVGGLVFGAISLVGGGGEGDGSDPRVGSLDQLHDRLDRCDDECRHVVHVWSPSMPLSELAIDEVAVVAEEMGVPFSVIAAEDLLADGPSSEGARSLRTSLVEAGATVHFPAVVLMNGVSPYGNAIVGHKRAAGYRTLLEPRLAALSAGSPAESAPVGVGSTLAMEGGTGPGDAAGGPTEVELLWRHPVDPAPGAFFRRVPGTRFITYDQRRSVFLRDLESDEEFIGPGFIDFVPTPDGRLFVTPSDGGGGLEFYLASAVFEEGRAGMGRRLDPIHNDPEMDDQYPSVGILDDVPGESTTYRILISWFEGLAFRDYHVAWGEESATVTALTPKIAACPGMGLSTPILSKDGFDIAARNERGGTTRVYRLADDGSCEEHLDLGMQTSKVGFSDDGRLIAFSSPNPAERGRSTTYVYDRERMTTTEVPFTEARGLMIPEFVGPDSLLVLAASDPARRDVEFRLLCCVR